MTGDVVNLRQFRKRKDRADKAAKAEQNRALHGRTKGEKARDDTERARAEADLDSKQIDRPAPSDD